MSARGQTAIGFGIVLGILGSVLVWGGLTPLSQYRDADGYFLSDALTIDRPSPAVFSRDVGLLRGHYECIREETFMLASYTPDAVRMQGMASGPQPLFLGIAPADHIDEYLEGASRDEITEWGCNVDHIVPVEYTSHTGATSLDKPTTKPFWVTSASGSGQQTLDWTITSGDWAVVIMNADGSPGVSADLRFGALAPYRLETMALTSFGVGLAALIGGSLLLYLGLRKDRNATVPHDGEGTDSLEKAPGRFREPAV